MSAGAAAPDDPSWTALALRLRPFLARRLPSAADVDDVLQEVLLRMHRGLPSLQDEQRVAAWMHRIARNAVADHLRARARHPLVAGGPAGEACDDDEAHDARAVDAGFDPADEEAEGDGPPRDLVAAVARFVERLPEEQRQALTLVELEGRTQKDAAALLGISTSGMKSRVQRGRARLRRLLEDCCAIALDARGRVVDCAPRGAGSTPDGCCG